MKKKGPIMININPSCVYSKLFVKPKNVHAKVVKTIKPAIVNNKKGKGSYSRKAKHKGDNT